jgi:putative ABC transport system permease protein
VRDWTGFVGSRLRLSGLTPDREARIVREVAVQLEDFYRDALARGLSDAEADAEACRQISDWDRFAQDVCLADRLHAASRFDRLADSLDGTAGTERAGIRGGAPMLSNVLRDARYSLRQLRKNPGFSIVAVLTLAIGIGATSAMFSVVNGVILRPLPFPEPHGLVSVVEILPRFGRFSVAPATFLDWRAQNTVLEHIAAYTGGNATFVDTGGPERVINAAVSWDVFELLRVPPELGRGFRAEEDAPGKANVIVLSHGMWQRRFGGDPGVLGRSVSLNGAPFTIVGVMPAGFRFPSRQTEYWVPLGLNPANASRGGHYLGVVARVKQGTSIGQADAELRMISERLALQYPDASAKESAEVRSLHEAAVGEVRPALLILFAAVGVVVLIACANVANLLLVRGFVRAREIAIRTALGAARRRLVSQMLVESLVISVVGGALGLLLAYFAISPIQTLSAGSIPRAEDISIDGRVLLFSLLLALATGVAFGLAPAWFAGRERVVEVLKEGGRSSTTAGGRRTRSVLLVAEVALSIILLVGATLLLRSFARVTEVDPGFQPERAFAFRVGLPNATYREEHQRVAFFERLLGQLDALPQVTAAGLVQSLPMRGDYTLTFTVRGRPDPKPGDETSANHRSISPDYFKALGVPLLRGRTFTPRDAEKAPMVAIVDQSFVDRYLPGQEPLGQGIDIGNGTDGFYEIVGVVGNVHHAGLDSDPSPTMYVPFKQDVFSSVWVVARTDSDPAQLAPLARQAVKAVDPAIPTFGMTPLANVVTDSVAGRRFSLLLLMLFAGVALFLAAVGLYGVVAYSVSQRTQEIGVRMAIGAERSHVLSMVLSEGMMLALVGVVIGLVGAATLSGLLSKMLFHVTPGDPLSYVVTAALLLSIAGLACFIPALRATRVDPIVALRQG